MERTVSDRVHGRNFRFIPNMKYSYIYRDGLNVCNYCGSMSPEDALIRLLNPEVEASGTDWKYGWPHKFYITLFGNFGKFYSNHLYDAPPETFKALTKLIDDKLKIRFTLDKTGLRYQAPYLGYQTWTNALELPGLD